MMRRRLIQLGLFLLLGAVVNVGVACACSQWAGRSDVGIYDLPGEDVLRPWWRANCPDVFPGEPDFMPVVFPAHAAQRLTMTDGVTAWGITAWYLWVPVRDGARTMHVRALSVSVGWPLRAMTGQEWSGGEAADTTRIYRWAISRGIDWQRSQGDLWGVRFGQRLIPLRPIWPGFAINTVFYAGVLWLLFALGGTPFALRRRRRIKRGLCPACAYPVGDNPVCTECGETLARRVS